MSDRADEIARELYPRDTVQGVRRRKEVAAALRAYGDERLEEAAKHLATGSAVWSASRAADIVRRRKSKELTGGTHDIGV